MRYLSTLTASVVVSTILTGCFEQPKSSSAPKEPASAVANPTTYQAMARGKVEVEGGLLEIKTAQSGQISRLAVTEGSKVKRGAELVELDAHVATLNLKTGEAELERALANQQAASQRLPAARQLTQRLQQASRLGASDAQRADDALQQQKQLEAAVAVANTEVNIARQQVAQAKERLAERTVFAPQAGTLVKVNTTLGAQVTPEDHAPLMVLLPDRPLLVRAELNESFVARVKLGMLADIVVEAAPDQPALKAHVIRIGEVFGNSHLNDDNPAHSSTRVVDCLLAFDQAPTLRIGQNVRVNFHD